MSDEHAADLYYKARRYQDDELPAFFAALSDGDKKLLIAELEQDTQAALEELTYTWPFRALAALTALASTDMPPSTPPGRLV